MESLGKSNDSPSADAELPEAGRALREFYHYTGQWKVNPREFGLLSSCPNQFALGGDLSGKLLGLREGLIGDGPGGGPMFNKEFAPLRNRALVKKDDPLAFTFGDGLRPQVRDHFPAEHAAEVPQEDPHRALGGQISLPRVRPQVNPVRGGG